jgi:hypothetical protein
MLPIFQLRIRDLLWFMLVCGLISSWFVKRNSLSIDAVIHSPIYIVGDTLPAKIDSDRYFVAIRGGHGFVTLYNPNPALKAQLDRLSSKSVPAHLHLAAPVPDPPSAPPAAD